MDIRLGRDITSELSQGKKREWLVTNGLGGYAMGSLAALRTRCYHGLLIAPFEPPAKRHLLMASADMWVDIHGRHFPLITHEWMAGVVLPDGYNNLEQFYLEGTIPVFRWSIGVIAIEQRIWMAYGENTTYVTWTYSRGVDPIRLILKPLISYRSHHDITAGGATVSVQTIPTPWEDDLDGVGIDILPSEYLGLNVGTPAPMPFRVFTNRGQLIGKEEWWWSFRLATDSARGTLDQEDLYNVAVIETILQPHETFAMVTTMEDTPPAPWQIALSHEQTRQKTLLEKADADKAPDWIKQLVLAADQFIVEYPYVTNDSAEPQSQKTIIAGYPWFGVWGRVALFSLPGLTLATGRADVARQILESFIVYVQDGMLPNLLSDETGHPEYNTVDVALWYIVTLWIYLQENPDAPLLEKLYPTLENMVLWYINGTRYQIKVDGSDGLLYVGETEIPLTWMDVKINNRAVTPRCGKIVEVNALWYNVLKIMESFAKQLGKPSEDYQKRAEHAHRSFNARFWNAGKGYLYDYIDAPLPNASINASLRPNQLFALSLPFRVLEDDHKARQVVDVCAHELLVSYGLRTLGKQEKLYKSRHDGTVEQRDIAYHQGVAWSWLLGPFVRAYYEVYKDAKAALSFFEPLAAHLADYGVGQIAEIFDGDPPFHPRGAVAYASGVAEILRMWRELQPYIEN